MPRPTKRAATVLKVRKTLIFLAGRLRQGPRDGAGIPYRRRAANRWAVD